MKLYAQYNRIDSDKVDLWQFYRGNRLHFATVHIDDFDKEISEEINDFNPIHLELKLA